MDTVNISQGINLHLIKTEKFKTTTVCLLIRRALTREEVTYNALIPSILKKGSEKYNTISKLNSVLEDMYGAVFDIQIVKIGEEQILQFYLETLNKEVDITILEKGLSFLAEIVFNPLIENEGFKEDVFNIEKENLKNKIKGRINNKAEYLKLKCIEKACKNQPFGIYADGYIEDLEEITAKNLYEHYKNILKTSPIEFVVIGKEEMKICEKIKELFHFKRENVIAIKKPEVIYSPKDEVKEREKLEVTQGKLCMILPTGISPVGQGFCSLLIMNEIFGASASSKLFVNIREKESLCYSIGSLIYRFKGLVMVQAGVDPENFDKVLALIQEEIKSMANGDITKEEIENAKRGVINQLNSIKDYAAATINFYVSQYILEDKNNIEQFINEINNVTQESIQNCAKKMYVDTIYLLG